MIDNLKDIIKNKDLIKFLEILYFKLNKTKYSYVDKTKPIIDTVKKDLDIKVKIAVYSCILGKYDDIHEPLYKSENVDYYMFTDQTIKNKNTEWIIIDVNTLGLVGNNVYINRYIKFHPNDFFPDYDYSIYIDGNISIISDIEDICKSMKNSNKFLGLHRHNQRDCIYVEADAINHLSRFNGIVDLVKKQIRNYKKEGFPNHYGLFENSIIVREHNNSQCIKLMNDWWNEYKKYPTRDQLSLPYIIRKNDCMAMIFILGNDLKKSKYFKYFLHR